MCSPANSHKKIRPDGRIFAFSDVFLHAWGERQGLPVDPAVFRALGCGFDLSPSRTRGRRSLEEAFGWIPGVGLRHWFPVGVQPCFFWFARFLVQIQTIFRLVGISCGLVYCVHPWQLLSLLSHGCTYEKNISKKPTERYFHWKNYNFRHFFIMLWVHMTKKQAI